MLRETAHYKLTPAEPLSETLAETSRLTTSAEGAFEGESPTLSLNIAPEERRQRFGVGGAQGAGGMKPGGEWEREGREEGRKEAAESERQRGRGQKGNERCG